MTINHSMRNQGLVKLVAPNGAVPAWQPLFITPDDPQYTSTTLELLFLTTYCPAAAWVGLWYDGPFTVPYAGLEEWRWEWPNEISGDLAGNGLITPTVTPLTDPRQPVKGLTITNHLDIYGFYNRTLITKRAMLDVAAPISAAVWLDVRASGATCRIDEHTTYNDGLIKHLRIPCFIPETEYTAAMLAADNIATGTWGADAVTLEILGLYKVVTVAQQ